MMTPRDRLIVALDTSSLEHATRLACLLQHDAGAFKVGLEAVHACGFKLLNGRGVASPRRIFYDCKLHDIPNTVAAAASAIVSHGVWMMNVHAAGGQRMMEAAVTAVRARAEELAVPRPLVIAVTLLTSLDPRELAVEMRVDASVTDYVVHMARQAQSAGCDGVVCSPREVASVRTACGPGFLLITPGVRPAWAERNDQRRTLTPGEAIHAGADFIVVGRPITGSSDPQACCREIVREIAAASEDGSSP